MLTSELKEVCSIFTSVIKNDKIRPITDLVEIYVKNGVAHIGSTDNRTTIVATINEDKDMDNAVISLSSLNKLVRLTTKENISLTHKGKYIEFRGNGKYKIPIQLDEMGNEVYLPLEMPDMEEYTEYESASWQKVELRNKVGLFTGDGHNEFTLYNIHNNNAVTSDSIVVAKTNNINLPEGDIQNFVVDQLSCFASGKMKFSIIENNYRISINNFEIYMINKIYDNFPIEMVEPFLVCPSDNRELFSAKMSLSHNDLHAAIKRQHIFKNPFDVPSVVFEVSDNIVYLKNVHQSVEEQLDVMLTYWDNVKVNVSTEIIMEVLRNMEDDINLYLGTQAICLEDNQGFYIISAMEG